MSSHHRTHGSVLIPSSVKVPVGKIHNWQLPPNLCLNIKKEEKAQRFHICYKNKFGGFNIFLQHIFLTLLGCSLLSKDEAEQEAFTCAGSRVVLLQVLLITISLLVCSSCPSCTQDALSVHGQRRF